MSTSAAGSSTGQVVLATIYLLPSTAVCWIFWVLGSGIDSTVHNIAGLLFFIINFLSYALMLIFLSLDKWVIGFLCGSLPIPACFLVMKLLPNLAKLL